MVASFGECDFQCYENQQALQKTANYKNSINF